MAGFVYLYINEINNIVMIIIMRVDSITINSKLLMRC